jgi:hypothetical protein
MTQTEELAALEAQENKYTPGEIYQLIYDSFRELNPKSNLSLIATGVQAPGESYVKFDVVFKDVPHDSFVAVHRGELEHITVLKPFTFLMSHIRSATSSLEPTPIDNHQYMMLGIHTPGTIEITYELIIRERDFNKTVESLNEIMFDKQFDKEMNKLLSET